MKDLGEIIEAIKSAQGEWTEADWTHVKGCDQTGEDETIYCEGGDDTCETCRDATRDAARASECGDRAITAIFCGDMDEAWEQLARASSIEGDYGDNPTWGPVLRMIEDGDVK